MHLSMDRNVAVKSGTIVVTNELEQAEATVTIPADATDVTVQLPHKGFFELRAHLIQGDGTPRVIETTAAVAGDPIPDAERLAAPFGLESVGAPAALVIAAGAGYNRGFTPQNGILRTASGDVAWWPGYHSTPPAEPLNIINAVMSPPGWVVAPEHEKQESITKTFPPSDWNEYQKVVRQFATSQSWVKGFEALNEPDASHWQGSDADLVQYHKAIREELRSVGLGQKLLGPCFWSIDLQHLDKLVKLGLLDSVDGISVHSYANAPPEGKWIGQIEQLKQYLASTAHPEEPIYLTEYGWAIGNGDKTTPEKELEQARYASRGIALLAREHLAAAIYFALRWTDGGTGPNWSVVHPDNTPRPGYAAIATAYRWLTGTTGGTLIHPSPSSYMIVFGKGEKSVGVAWDTQESSRIQLPGKPARIESMTGEAVAKDADGCVTLTQSPLYFETADSSLAKLAPAPTVTLLRGQSRPWSLASHETALPAALSVRNGVLRAGDDALPGSYTGFVKSGSGWQIVPIDVKPLWSVTSAIVVWPRTAAVPSVRLTLRSVTETAEVTPILRLEGRPDEFGAPIALIPDHDTIVDIPIHDYRPGETLSGSATLEGKLEGRLEESALKFRVLPIPCQLQPTSAPPDWDTIPAVPSSAWRMFGPDGDAAIAPSDCSATLKVVATPANLLLHVAVRDDVLYAATGGDPLWSADSIQIAFDLSASPEARDRRELEFIAAKQDSRNIIERDRSTIDSLPAGVPDSGASAAITRKGDVTTYDIALAWPSLDLPGRPAAAQRVGFDIAINDSDGKGQPRHGLEMVPGIVATKDTAAFAELLLR